MVEAKPIIIENFQKGIAISPLSGFGEMRNINISNVPGLAKCGFKSYRQSHRPFTETKTFTADAGTDICTANGTLDGDIDPLVQYQPFTLTTTGTLPAGLSTSTVYFFIRLSSTTFKVASTLANAIAGTPIDITDAGSGTHTINLIYPKRIKQWTENPSGTRTIYGQDVDGRVWKSTDGKNWYLVTGNTLPTANTGGHGLVYWKDYLFAFRSNAVDLYGPLSGSASWSNSWGGGTGNIFANSSAIHSAIVGRDGLIYYCNDVDTSTSKDSFLIGSIDETAGPFDPTDSGTYNVNGAALDIQAEATCLTELGRRLMIGAKDNKIYPWDEDADSFEDPISLPESYTYAMVTFNNRTYLFTGTQGNIYVTNGADTAPYKKIPDEIIDNYYIAGTYTIYSSACMVGSNLLFCFSSLGDTPFIGNIDTITGGFITTDISTTTTATILGAIYAYSSKHFIVGWSYSTTDSGIDSTIQDPSTGSEKVDNSYGSYIISPYYQVGTQKNKRTFKNIEVQFADKLTTSQGYKIYYRENLSDSWTQIGGTVDYATYGAIKSWTQDFAATLESIQIKVELTGLNLTTPALKSIMLR